MKTRKHKIFGIGLLGAVLAAVFFFTPVLLLTGSSPVSADDADKGCHAYQYWSPPGPFGGKGTCLNKKDQPRSQQDCNAVYGSGKSTFVAASTFGGAAHCEVKAPQGPGDCDQKTTYFVKAGGVGISHHDNECVSKKDHPRFQQDCDDVYGAGKYTFVKGTVTNGGEDFCQKKEPTSQADCTSSQYFEPATPPPAAQPARCLEKKDHPRNINDCPAGYNFIAAGSTLGATASCQSNPDAFTACKDYGPDGKDHNNTFYEACLDGFTHKKDCDKDFAKGSDPQKACQTGADGADASGGDDTSACIANSNTTLEWLLCPLITALSKGADKINGFVEDQLNFDTSDFLPKSGDDNGAYKAWTVIKDLVTSVLIILLLVMVISQALGNGIFEAYTVKKVLPRLVIAVIGMQLSWDLCTFVINIADHLGEGLAQIMAAPFGGRGNLDLGSLLHHLGTGAAIATEVTLMAVLVSAVFIGPILAPGALLVAFSIMMAVLIGLASVLFRNIIIIACVVLSPLALLLWVMPGKSLQGYYKTWSDNFTKCLLLFPLMIGIIYGGRIFAFIAGGAAKIGFLNIIMVLVGFFGPYFILPKAFKWGGSWMKAGADAIANNAAVKKGGELGRKELLDVLRRKQGEIASQYNPDDKMLKFRRGKLFGKIPVPVAGGRLGTRIQSGAILPTERNRRLAIKKGDEWKNERNDEALAYNKRKMEMGFSNGYEHDYIDEDGNKVHEKIEPGLKAGKQALVDMAGYDGDDPLMKRAAEMAVVQLLDSNSYWELQNSRIGGTGKYAGLRVQDTEAWQKKLQTTPDMWSKASKRPDTIPTVTSEEYGGDDDEKTLQILAKYAPEKYTGKTDADWKRYKDAHKEYFKVEDDGKGNIKKGYLARRLDDVHKKQAQLKGTPARLDDADRQTKALRDGYADAASSSGYAEGWWDEMKDQRAKGNTAASEEMLKQLIQTAANGQAGLSTLNPLSNGQLRDKVNEALGGAKNNDILGALITAANTANSRPDAAKAILDHLKVDLNAEAAVAAAAKTGGGEETLPQPAIPTVTAPAATEAGGGTTTAPAAASSSTSGSSGGGPAGGGGTTTPGTTGPAPGAGYGTMPLNEANMEHFGRAMERAVSRGIESSRMGRVGVQPQAFEVRNIPAATVEAPRQETVVRLANEGELRISHRPGEVTPGGVILPTGVRDTRNEPPAGS